MALAFALGNQASAYAQDTVQLTLDSCLRYAHKHNTQILSATLNEESAEVSLSQAKMRFMPSINASASHGYSWSDQTTRSTSAGINGSLTLFNGLSNLRTLQQSRLSAEQNHLKMRQTENSVDEQIISAYLTILMNQEKLSYQEEVLATSRQQEEEGALKYQVGRLLESDYLLLQANYLSAKSEIENTRLTIEDNRFALAALLGMDDNTVVGVVASVDSIKAADQSLEPADSVIQQARRAMPDWQISEMNVTLARYNVQLAHSAFMPTVSLNAGTSYNDGAIISDDPVTNINGGLNSSVTVGVSIPLLNQGSSLTQLKQSKIALREAELQHHQTLIDLEDNLQTMYLGMQQALNRFRASERLAEAYHASYDVYVVKYGEGAVTTVEMLQQQERYLSALNDYLQSKYSFILAEKQLDIYTGKEITL